jgi:hypothetical protein
MTGDTASTRPLDWKSGEVFQSAEHATAPQLRGRNKAVISCPQQRGSRMETARQKVT